MLAQAKISRKVDPIQALSLNINLEDDIKSAEGMIQECCFQNIINHWLMFLSYFTST